MPLASKPQRFSVVPAYPYEGAIYWMLAEPQKNPKSQLGHPYYRSLYGPQATEASFRARTAAAICLFDTATLAAADAFIPDAVKNENVRFSVSTNFIEWDKQHTEKADALWSDPKTKPFIARYRNDFFSEDAFRHIICRLLTQMHEATASNSILLAGQMLQDFLVVLDQTSSPSNQEEALFSKTQTLNPDELDIYGLNFSPADVDAFAAVRSSTQIKEYGHEFCRALFETDDPLERERKFVAAIKNAMDNEEISKKSAGVLETNATVAGVVGLIPGADLIAGPVGLAADAGARAARKKERRNQWFLVGSKMQEVATRDFLARKANLLLSN